MVAKNTVEALQSGAVFGFAGLVDGMVARIRTEQSLNDDVTVVADRRARVAGAGELDDHGTHEPLLTLRGLYQAFARNTC